MKILSFQTGAGNKDNRRDLSLGPYNGYDMTPTKEEPVESDPQDNNNSISILSKSQPDLTKLEGKSNDSRSPSKDIPLLSEKLSGSELAAVVDLLHSENMALKLEVEMYSRKVEKLQRFEVEILKFSDAHENLVEMCSRREQLEKLARTKLQNQVQVCMGGFVLVYIIYGNDFSSGDYGWIY